MRIYEGIPWGLRAVCNKISGLSSSRTSSFFKGRKCTYFNVTCQLLRVTCIISFGEEGGFLPVWAMNINRQTHVKTSELSIHVSFLYFTVVAERDRFVLGQNLNCIVSKVIDISIYSFSIWYSTDLIVQRFSPGCNLWKSCYECGRVLFQ